MATLRQKAQAKDTLKACILEYQTWDAEYCKSALLSLQRPAPQPEPSPILVEDGSLGDSGSDTGEFICTEFEEETGVSITTGTAESFDVYVSAEFLRHPGYDSCTPAARNIMVGDDSDYMPFMPFADDPTFGWKAYSNEYKYLAWQVYRPDPDLEIVAIEAIQRLTIGGGMDPSVIDAMGLFPARPKPTSTPAITRLTRLAARRDFPTPLPPGWTHSLRYSTPYSDAGPSAVFQSHLDSFCHNPSCLTGYCTVHLGCIPEPVPVVPSVTLEALSLSAEKICGAGCFLTPTLITETEWTEEDEELLRTVLTHSPDALPCDLATICRRPCFEVYKRQGKYLESLKSSKDRAARRRIDKRSGMIFSDYDANTFKPSPAAIPAPATRSPAASATNTTLTAHITVDAITSVYASGRGAAVLRRPDKRSAIRSVVRALLLCASAIPVCALDSVAVPCSCGEDEDTGDRESPPSTLKGSCSNMMILRGVPKKTRVRRGKWGLGLFISEDANPGDLVSEYIGELIYDDTVQARDHISRHKGRTYLFQLNSKLSIDSGFVGNEARFINHDPKHFNTQASILMVSGEHRIGFFATKHIPEGSEILINYGPEFFKEQNPPGVSSASGGSTSVTTPKRMGNAMGKEVKRVVEDADVSYEPSPDSGQSTSQESKAD
ncbi:hypothetical protein D9611_012914 [Ephemerocybe angulata]|uniref:SET domain-containing protein n=1 Tax=Ephemerocybe angulata TaxID=980116 RepID=A0A8H5FFL7_9AGAR|nr:hypothetical protein D9611_012914 [Tulosesus angulatus]